MTAKHFVWTKRELANQPPVRRGAAMAYDPVSRMALLFGGLGVKGVLNDTWGWDQTQWHEHTASPSPAPRAFASLAAGRATNELVLFGGTDSAGNVLSDTWVWDGSAWRAVEVATPPPARSSASLASSPGGGVLLYGGIFGARRAQFLGDTWLWKDGRWKSVGARLSPPARAFASMVFDSSSGTARLFGGANGLNLGDTWSWDGSQWTVAEMSSPPPARQGGLAAYYESQGVTVVTGGHGDTQTADGVRHPVVLNDVWTLKGSAWERSETSTLPPTANWGVIAFGADISALVLFTDNGARGFGSSETWIGSIT